jgi:Ca-activated chloride channel family protein
MKHTAVRTILAIALMVSAGPSDGAQSKEASSSTAPTDGITVPSGQKFILQLETPLHTRTTRKGDKVEFRTAADILVESHVLIPNQSLIRGTVTKARRAGVLAGRAEIYLHLDDVQLANRVTLPIQATIIRVGVDPLDAKSGKDPKIEGEAGAGANAKAVASAGAQGAIIGILVGGPKGAMYGAGVGAAVTLIGSALRRGPDLDLPRSTMMEARFDKPLQIPAASLAAQNAQAAGPPIQDTDSSAREASAVAEISSVSSTPDAAGDVPSDSPRPYLKRRPGPQEPDVSSGSNSEPHDGSSTPATPAPVPAAEDAKSAGSAVASLKLSVKVKMVVVDALVRDRSGYAIENIQAEDFRVYEDGVLQAIASLSHDELPLAVALVVDRSGSVSPYIAELRRIASQALQQLKQEDEVCLFSFAGDVQRMEDLTTDRQRIARALDRIHAGGSTDIMDALHDAVGYLSVTAPDRRHAIILVSDNQQTANPQASERETITKMLETDTVVYSLKTQGTPLQIGLQLPSVIFGDSVKKVAQETGGEVINVSKVASMNGALAGVISRLRTRYSIGYYPSGGSQGGAFHEITVRLDDKFGKPGRDYFIQAKRGYYETASRN